MLAVSQTCNRITSATAGVATRLQIGEFMGRSCRQLWFISPPCHQSVKDLRVHFWFNALSNEVLSLPRDSIWHGAYFQYLAPNLVQNCQKKIPPMYLTLCHMQPQMSGVVRIKQILIPICWYVHLVKELYYMFTTGSTIFFNSFQVHDTLFMYGWLMIESSSAEDLLHIWWWSTAAAFVRTGDGGTFNKKSFVCVQSFSQ